MSSLHAVRVEGETSIGRSYSARATTVPGLGAKRRELRTRSFEPYAGDKLPVLESATLALANLKKSSREDVLAYFENTWALTDSLFSALRDDSVFYSVPDKLRRPLIFYFGHPAALYVNKMHQAGLLDNINPYFAKLFETGVDEMSWDDMDVMQDEDFAWPDVCEVIEFRAKTKEAVTAVIRDMPNPHEHPVNMESPFWALFMAFEHERIHLETSSVLIHQLPIDSVVSPPGWRTAPTNAPVPEAAPTNNTVVVPGCTVVLGKPTDFPSFGWDNEYGKRVVTTPSFSVSKYLCSNAEFLPFVLAGGYTQRQWWVAANGDDEGWRWASYRNATHPSFWVATSHPDQLKYHGGKPGLPYQKDDGHPRAGSGAEFMYRSQFDIIAMPWDWPVEVNYHEAAAFMRWKAAQEGGGVSYRFPTEAEFHALRADPCPYPEATIGTAPSDVAGRAASHPTRVAPEEDGKTVATASAASVDEFGRVDVILQPVCPGNTNMRWHSSTPVDHYSPSAAGVHDPHGNVWQWVEDHFAPLPGFEIHYLYDDFSSPCFDGWHTCIMGGSWVSTGDLSSSFARYHFRRHFFQHLGFRYVRIAPEAIPEPYPGAATVTNLWEGANGVSSDITNAFGTVADKLPFSPELVAPDASLNYSSNVAKLAATAYSSSAAAATTPAAAARVLHIGCGVGGTTMELCRYFGKVVGLDNREPAIRHARILQHHGQFEYERVREGVLTDTALVRVPAGIDRSRALYVLGDACALPQDITSAAPFDVVVVDSLLTRLRQPLDLLKILPTLVAPGGTLLVTSSHDWDPKHTPRNSWLGGFKMNGEDMGTLHMLRYSLKRAFDQADVSDIARMARSHARRFTLDILQASTWRRKADASTEGGASGGSMPVASATS